MRSEYLDDFEAFLQALNREIYLHGSGQKAGFALAPIFDRHADLFRRGEIDELRAGADDATFDREHKARRRLLAAGVGFHLEALVVPLSEEIASHEARATIFWEGRDVPFRSTEAMIAREARAEARRELASRRERVIEETNDLRAERLEKLHDGARALGADSYAALWSDLRGLDYGELSAGAAGLLAETERPFADALETALRVRAGLRLGEAARADVLHALRLTEFDRFFRPHRLRDLYADVFAGLGIRAGAQPNIIPDLAERATKLPRPFVAPVRVPEEVRVVVRVGNGFGDYQALLGAGARAQHAGFVSPDVRAEFRRAGDGAVGEAFGLLFESLMLEPDWLGERFRLGQAAADVRSIAALGQCFRVRGCAARLILQEEIHSGRRSLAGAPARYAEATSEVTAAGADGAEYLVDLGEGLAAADTLRAWALAVRLRDYFRTRFGHRWWSSRAAGELLKEVWTTGGEYTAEELASELDLGPLSLDLLATEVVLEMLR